MVIFHFAGVGTVGKAKDRFPTRAVAQVGVFRALTGFSAAWHP